MTMETTQPDEFSDELDAARVPPYIHETGERGNRCMSADPENPLTHFCELEMGHDRILDGAMFYDHAAPSAGAYWDETKTVEMEHQWTQIAAFSPTPAIMLTTAYQWWSNLVQSTIVAHGFHQTRVRHTAFGELLLEVQIEDHNDADRR